MKRDEKLWVIEQQGFDPFTERRMESIFCLGNGKIGSRGFSIPPIPSSYPDLFIAGVYDRKVPAWPYSEAEFLSASPTLGEMSELVSFPSPFQVVLRVESERILPGGHETIGHERALDLKNGQLTQQFIFRVNSCRGLSFKTTRLISLHDPNLLLQEIQWVESRDVFSEQKEEKTPIEISLDFSLIDTDFHLKHPHLKGDSHEWIQTGFDGEKIHQGVFYTQASEKRVVFLIKSWVMSSLCPEARAVESIKTVFRFLPGEVIKIRRLIRIGINEDDESLFKDYDSYLNLHIGEWEKFWSFSDLTVNGCRELQQSQRFNLYQLRIAVDAGSPQYFSVPARGLSGRAYEGHIFWDAEVFILPFFLFQDPEIAKRILFYRYQTLPGAKLHAQKLGYSGACYAWESTISGRDVTPSMILLKSTGTQIPIFTGRQQIHVTADVAYAVWRYWEVTQDAEWMTRMGVEILIETARFWASRVEEDRDGFHIRKVVGPDEYHHDVDDNAYTNWMAKFNLEKAVWASRRFGWMIDRGEVKRWGEIAARMVFPIRPDGLIEQFQGFFELAQVALKKNELYQPPVDRLFEWEKVNRLQLVKQADVLMLFFLFPNAFHSKVVELNYLYYAPMTDHGSSLSAPVHAAVAAQIGRRDEAESYWRKSLFLDLKDLMKNTSLGIHVGCMGAAWQSLIFHILGVHFDETGPILPERPWERLPRGCRSCRFQLNYRGKVFPIEISQPDGGK